MTDHFNTLPFPRSREIVMDAGRLGSRRHLIHGLVEFDITVARQYLREQKAATGESLSFTAFIAASLARAIQEYPMLQAYRSWRNQLIIYDEVDVVVMIEAEKDMVAIPHVLRGADRKTFRELNQEIRQVQAAPRSSPQTRGLSHWGQYAPYWVRRLFYGLLLRNPRRFQQYGGTVVITSVGMFGKGGGWGIGFLPMHTLGLTLGGISEKLTLQEGQLEVREYLCLTISVDHDIVDGAPAARFTQRLRELVEGGDVLFAEG
jgi:pyruvate/2-oxoglutarate dehydrogenase complex dihydrolipoamide acyltransferase (E2) component